MSLIDYLKLRTSWYINITHKLFQVISSLFLTPQSDNCMCHSLLYHHQNIQNKKSNFSLTYSKTFSHSIPFDLIFPIKIIS